MRGDDCFPVGLRPDVTPPPSPARISAHGLGHDFGQLTAIDDLDLMIGAGQTQAIVGPSGENFYPAFYADNTIDRRKLETVAKVLGPLPAAAKFFFFTAKSTLLQSTPLQALRMGRVDEVLTAAAGFAER